MLACLCSGGRYMYVCGHARALAVVVASGNDMGALVISPELRGPRGWWSCRSVPAWFIARGSSTCDTVLRGLVHVLTAYGITKHCACSVNVMHRVRGYNHRWCHHFGRKAARAGYCMYTACSATRHCGTLTSTPLPVLCQRLLRLPTARAELWAFQHIRPAAVNTLNITCVCSSRVWL
jgi:hypothetical protein